MGIRVSGVGKAPRSLMGFLWEGLGFGTEGMGFHYGGSKTRRVEFRKRPVRFTAEITMRLIGHGWAKLFCTDSAKGRDFTVFLSSTRRVG